MTTLQVVTAAYAEIFGIDVHENGYYYGQHAGSSEIDYAMFDRCVQNYDIDAGYIAAITEDGNEGCWIGVFYICDSIRFRVGTIKTLAYDRAAWQDMGALAGELAYVANNIIAWKLYQAEKQKDGDA